MNMNPPSLLCIGELLVDLVPDADGRYEPRLGGAPANVAIISAALGVSSALVSRIGEDWLGRLVAQQLRTTRTNTAMVQVLASKTGLAVVAPRDEGPPGFLMYREASADAQIVLRPPEREAVRSAQVVHLSSLLPTSSHGRDMVEEVLTTRRHTGGLLSFDVNLRPTAWDDVGRMREWTHRLLARAHIVKVTESELAWLDLSVTGRHDTLWLITNGAHGARLVGPHGEVSAAAPTVPVVDTTGAGDAALAGLLSRVILGDTDPHALTHDEARSAVEYAVWIGSEVVQHVGATSWSPKVDA